MMTNPRGFSLITTFGLGHFRPASGTWGSMPPVAIAAVLGLMGLGPASNAWVFPVVFGVILIVFSAACIIYGDRAEAKWGKDPSEVVADETAGQSIALIAFPALFDSSPIVLLAWLAAAFFVFRFFDITKIEPADMLQRIPGPWGVLLDDIAAGLYTLATLWAAALLIG